MDVQYTNACMLYNYSPMNSHLMIVTFRHGETSCKDIYSRPILKMSPSLGMHPLRKYLLGNAGMDDFGAWFECLTLNEYNGLNSCV